MAQRVLTPRQRRLQADYESLVRSFSGHPNIRVEPIGPAPASRYRIIYNVPGLRLTADRSFQTTNQHVVNMQLPGQYPREKPYCTTEAQIFHPNFGNYICIADFWGPSQSLVDVVVQIGDMLQYKLFNTRSPLNARAALWARQNIDSLPIGSIELLPLEPEVRLRTARTTVDEQAS